LSQKSFINTTISRITTTTNSTTQTMSFSTTSPACVSVAMNVVSDALPMAWDSATEHLLSPPTYLLSKETLPESEEDNIVILETRAVQHRFLDDEGKIELMGEKGSSDKKMESEVNLEEVKETVKKEAEEEKEPDKEWWATGTWPSWRNNQGGECGWGGNAQLMANDSWGLCHGTTRMTLFISFLFYLFLYLFCSYCSLFVLIFSHQASTWT